MKKTLYIILLSTLLTGCADHVNIAGQIDGAAGKMIHLRHETPAGTQPVDSVRATKDGTFTFHLDHPRYPEFYRLTVDAHDIVIALDSTTEIIHIKADKDALIDARIEGSAASADIQRLRRSAYTLQALAREGNPAAVDSALAQHKTIARHIILSGTGTPAAYYAIHQTINGMYIFHPGDKTDLPYWTAVATAYDIRYPRWTGTEELKTTVLAAQRDLRTRRLIDEGITVDADIVGAIDLNLPDRSGERTRLSSLQGKVVLLDFSAYGMETSTAHTLFLRELYDEYHARGLEIYQVSSDADKLLWLEHSRQVPWISVRDDNAPQSMSVIWYNVRQLPTFFVIDRNGDIVGRPNHENVRTMIDKSL